MKRIILPQTVNPVGLPVLLVSATLLGAESCGTRMKRLSLASNIQVPLASSTVLTVRKPVDSITLLRTNGPTWVRVPQRSDRYLQR